MGKYVFETMADSRYIEILHIGASDDEPVTTTHDSHTMI